jgi:hypothetical protein
MESSRGHGPCAQCGDVIRDGGGPEHGPAPPGNSERCEFAVGRRELRLGATIYIGWKSKVSLPRSTSWNGIFQPKCHGSHVADQPLVWSVRDNRLTLDNHEDIGGKETSRKVGSTGLPQKR